MDIYQIMARLDAIGSKKTLKESQEMAQPVAEGRFKELDIILQAHPEAVEEFKRTGELSTELYRDLFDFYEDQMDYGTAKARTGDPYEFIGDKLSDALGLNEVTDADLDAQALAQHKARLARDRNRRELTAPAAADVDRSKIPAAVRKARGDQELSYKELSEAFAKGERVMYMNTFATVVGQDGDAYVIKVDGQTTTMKVPANAIKKPSYDESVEEASVGEGNAFSKAVRDAKADGIQPGEKITVGGKTYPVKEAKKAKPDFLDIDKDGDKKEPMKKAAKDKKAEVEEGIGKKIAHGIGKAVKKVAPDWVEKQVKADAEKQAKAKKSAADKFTSIAQKDTKKIDEVFPGTPEYELRFGKPDSASAFDKKKISTGTVYSRRYKDEPEADDSDTPKKKGRPAGSKRALGAKGPGVNSKLLKGKGGLKEQDIDVVDRGEYDREGDMALTQVHQIADAVKELHSILDADANLPEWVQSKITKALDYIDTARDYLDAEQDHDREAMKEAGYSAKAARAGKDIGKPGKTFAKIAKSAGEKYGSKERGEKVAGAVLAKLRAKEGAEPVEEKAVSKAQQKFMGMVHAAQKGEKPASKEVAKVAKEMPKKAAKDYAATKHKGLPQHVKKDKKEEAVEETTVAGSVATAPGAAPKKAKGGMEFGKGVYEGALAESFDKKLSTMLNESTNLNVSVDDQGQKSVSVSATGADADNLSDLLKMAGLFSSEGYSRACPHCGGVHEGSCRQMEEAANSPDEQYADTEYMTQTLSGGLNGPKTTGQTTGPIVNRQDSRQGVMAKVEEVKEAVESSLWDLYKKIDTK